MNRQHLLSRLGKKHDILYSTGLFSVWERDTEEWRSSTWTGDFRQEESIVNDAPSKLILRWPSTSLLDRTAIRWGVLRWKAQLKRMGSGPLVAHIFHPAYWPYVKPLNPDYLVYHPYDLFSHQPGWDATLACWQSALLTKADLVVASSEILANELATSSGRDVRVLLNAADFEAFSDDRQNVLEPADMASIPHPRVGYTGNINRKVDLSLIAEMAERNPAWHFVFVGAVGNLDGMAEDAFEVCKTLGNVHFLGEKSHSVLPSYILHMDVNHMCYRLGDDVWTRVAYPLKLHEYLAAGLPIVSADLQSLHGLRNVLATASGRAEWETAIRNAIAGRGPGSRDTRRAVARQNTWDERVRQLNRYLMQMVDLDNAGRRPEY